MPEDKFITHISENKNLPEWLAWEAGFSGSSVIIYTDIFLENFVTFLVSDFRRQPDICTAALLHRGAQISITLRSKNEITLS